MRADNFDNCECPLNARHSPVHKEQSEQGIDLQEISYDLSSEALVEILMSIYYFRSSLYKEKIILQFLQIISSNHSV
jgi:hypothetical protein